MSRWQLIGLGLVAYALGLIATAPATLIDARLDRASAGGLRLAEAHGTLWSGTGQIEIRDASRDTGIAKHIAWRFRPAYLLRGRLFYEVTLDHAARHFPVTVSATRIEVEGADINLPAATLGLGAPKLAPLGLTGDMLLHIARLSFGRGSVQGNATLQWRGAGSAFTRISPLGDYELRLEGDGAAVRASLRTLQGPLQLDGQGSWSSGQNPQFRGSARVPPPQQQQLSPLLRMIAVERGAGRFELLLK
ncbi:MAG: type II secretion system protein N [Burkholderiales bacterium]|nr:type II secretion system protein N [Burkholderiales bacterium]